MSKIIVKVGQNKSKKNSADKNEGLLEENK